MMNASGLLLSPLMRGGGIEGMAACRGLRRGAPYGVRVAPARWCTANAVAAKPAGLVDDLSARGQRYLVLGKIKLTGLVAFTASVGFAVAGGPVFSLAHTAVFAGTMLQSMAANTCNQVAERDFDKMMKRTDRRPMVKGTVTPREARALAAAELLTGTALLYSVDPVSAALGVSCWALYVHGYTPMKRVHWLNTWVGAVVGALPPMMGCVGAGAGILSPECLFLAALLYLWQIPHFLSLAYLNRRDYKAAGFQMLSHIDTPKAGAFSVRYAVYTSAVCTLGPVYFGFASPFFAAEAAAMGAYFCYCAQLFRNDPLRNARKLFLISIAYLPVILVLLCLHCDKLDMSLDPKLLCPVASAA
eukprot:TRINITY_DN33396_c0_g1_i1.p1 TRINITY_DN33396_c0_g1~~TRINITY_DN33396_c0_g1_i1.p1  ORF type:complete len:359 (+),score=119.00 TRINITY_DN33396_c0_g1_i1:86-1162(+)